ncbi:LAFE_0H00980g1_1 [Lachancea fermentati]|uniref:LAFE_0H00980g1_1 n=1 Tax=Lachancea fermentati TaxID=4955 RepID=A0A1G4MJ29_LACFM|nr:LAFE_0H00980g1_1 [Lachancea fermentati]
MIRYCPRVTAQRFCRLKSTTPDNAPRASDNEEWLSRLSGSEHIGDRTNSNKLKHGIDLKESNSSSLSNSPARLNHEIKIISTPPDTSYIHVKSPLSNFTSMSYLQSKKHRQTQLNGFVDIRMIKCRSGSGGNGVVSFFRDAGRAIGPPDGGDGGDGGSVYVQAVEGMNSLAKLRTTYIASDGENGASDQLDGARGKDVLISVPVGTIVKWCLEPKVVRQYVDKMQQENSASLRQLLNEIMVSLQCTGRFAMDQKPSHIQLFRDSYEDGEGWLFKGKDREYHMQKEWFQELREKVKSYDYDLTETELQADRFPIFGIDLNTSTQKPICILKGGKGGLGNMHFLTNLIRNPRFAKCGRRGLEQYFMFELKSLADLGLVGLPNAGKSTILNQISNARPRIGHWQFTTTHPSIGTISLGINKPSFTVADIPGLIRGASLDKGMGIEFLRHIERSNGWVLVLSLENMHPEADLQILIEELGGIKRLQTKKILVVCNKADIDVENPNSKRKYDTIKSFCDTQGWDVVPISALKGENIDLLLEKMAKCAMDSKKA